MMEKMFNFKATMEDGEVINAEEVLDVGGYYYISDGPKIRSINKFKIAELEYTRKEHCSDSTAYQRKRGE